MSKSKSKTFPKGTEISVLLNYVMGNTDHGHKFSICVQKRTEPRLTTTEMIHGEAWVDIPGYEGFYQVSNMGRVKSADRVVNRFDKQIILPGRCRKASSAGRGYSTVLLSLSGQVKACYIHRLVAEAFIPNPDSKRTVNHINGIKSDNRVENLEWCTYSENMVHAFKSNLR